VTMEFHIVNFCSPTMVCVSICTVETSAANTREMRQVVCIRIVVCIMKLELWSSELKHHAVYTTIHFVHCACNHLYIAIYAHNKITNYSQKNRSCCCVFLSLYMC
jgi:hypothetical protein